MKKIILIAAVIIGIAAAAASSDGRAQKEKFARKLSTFSSIVKELQTNYVDTLDATTIMDKTIGALLYQIDPYTEYYPADNQDELLSISSGKYAGVGSLISRHGKDVIFAEPMWDSPARRAGVRAGDKILVINGDTVTEKTPIDEVSKRLRGQAGTELTVDICRPYTTDSLITVKIVREDIKVHPVPYFCVDSTGIGYIALTTFNENSARDMRDGILSMMRDPRLKGIVIDLRGNGGGLLESAVQIASYFVPKGTEIVRTRGRNAQDERIFKTTRQPLDTKIPLAILVDGGTASASEILSGSMQDLDRAVIVGERSFGKGLVQTTRPLPYDDILKITTGKYYIPSGRLIQALDYSRRNPDGSPARTPDSLTNEFATKAGRIVRDGGGITPDVSVTLPESNRLLYNIVTDQWAYDFVTRYVAMNPAPESPSDLKVTDSMFEDFKQSIDPNRFKYDKQSESALELLRETAKSEGYLTDSVAAQLDILSSLLKHDLNHDLDLNRDEIMDILDTELASRYFSDADRVARTLPSDSVLLKAREILLDPARYSAILSKPKK